MLARKKQTRTDTHISESREPLRLRARRLIIPLAEEVQWCLWKLRSFCFLSQHLNSSSLAGLATSHGPLSSRDKNKAQRFSQRRKGAALEAEGQKSTHREWPLSGCRADACWPMLAKKLENLRVKFSSASSRGGKLEVIPQLTSATLD